MLRYMNFVFLVGVFLTAAPLTAGAEELQVYKSPTCGCCVKWISHLEEFGFTTQTHHPGDLDGLKKELGVTPQSASCHTAVSEQGYVFEGHVPAKYVQQFLDNPAENAIGLAVPAMPLGSPGMEMGDRFQPYKVFQLNKDGSLQVYASVEQQADQY